LKTEKSARSALSVRLEDRTKVVKSILNSNKKSTKCSPKKRIEKVKKTKEIETL
jgi:hypothetical protein